MQQDKFNKLDFIMQCVNLRNDMKFQYWFNGYPSKTFYKFEEIRQVLFLVNNLFLRTSIETKELTEVRIDLDESSLNKNIDLGLSIYNIFKSNNIKSSFYYSGGKGIHIQFLLNIDKYNLKLDERKKFKELFLKKLNILHLIDKAPLSPHTLLGVEGYAHRKTNKNKIYINVDKYNNNVSILDYITKNSDKILIDFNFFNNINEIPENIKIISAPEPIKPINTTKHIQKQKSPLKKPLKTSLSQDNLLMLSVFETLYKKHNVKSNYRFSILFIKYFYDKRLDKNTIEDLFNLIKFSLNKDWDFEPAYLSCEKLTGNFFVHFRYLENDNNDKTKNIGITYSNFKTIKTLYDFARLKQ
jgi:hypothetical protein